MRVLSKFSFFLEKVEVTAASTFLAVAVGICLYSIFVRTAGGSVGSWTHIAIQYLVIWTTFLGVGALVKRGRHIRVLIFISLLSHRAGRAFEVAAHLAGLIICLGVAGYGVHQVMMAKSSQVSVFEFFNLPIYPFAVSVPVGMALMSFHFIERLLLFFSPSSGEGKENGERKI